MAHKPYDIFVSYERDHDSPRVYTIVSLLELLDPSLRVFVDRRELPNGEQFDINVEREATTARMVLGAISRHSARSPAVAWECGQGRNRGVLAMMLVGPRPGRGDWVMQWYDNPQRTQYIDLARFQNNIFDPRFCELADLVAARLDRPALRDALTRLRSSLAATRGEVADPSYWINLIQEADSIDALASIRSAFSEGPVREALDQRVIELEKKERESGTWPDGARLGSLVDERTEEGVRFRDAVGLPVMVTIPPGAFLIGAGAVDAKPGERSPGRQIQIQRRFAVSEHLLTFAAWDFAVDNGLELFLADAGKKDSHGLDRALYPLFDVSWSDAVGYCLWATRLTGKRYRLLSEAEWEYCCRAGVQRSPYHCGDRLTRSHANFGRSREAGETVPVTRVGSYLPNRFKLFDMHGNLWEWVEDAWQPGFENIPVSGQARVGGSRRLRTVRGGSWANHVARLCSTSRSYREMHTRDEVTGVRVARDL